MNLEWPSNRVIPSTPPARMGPARGGLAGLPSSFAAVPQRRHRLDRALQRVERMTRSRVLNDAHRRAAAVLAVDRAGDADRLGGLGDRRVATDLAGDGVTQPADPDEFEARRRPGKAPVEVELRLTGYGDAAGCHHKRRRAELLDEMSSLGLDVAVVEIDDDHGGLGDVGGPGPPTLLHGQRGR